MIGSEYKQQTRIKCLQNLVILCINFEQSNNDVCYFDLHSTCNDLRFGSQKITKCFKSFTKNLFQFFIKLKKTEDKLNP